MNFPEPFQYRTKLMTFLNSFNVGQVHDFPMPFLCEIIPLLIFYQKLNKFHLGKIFKDSIIASARSIVFIDNHNSHFIEL